ncbi:sulfatase-like hydrolase/transferase [Natronosporangium hydrolyticum]|uniref:Sulfatase-like hydrolase/transferase n=1 Tax=Natronosporangium hydrolyticum TaxID=2811111 RepID=A0A895YCG9_9ACTN|nr:sulfatase-like hydrolase/transferase [Natronosporangium hydrolyticum]QSB13915.1 sulfatase-like hydrolase/transferase [Natronosporangium hydrolyticum]
MTDGSGTGVRPPVPSPEEQAPALSDSASSGGKPPGRAGRPLGPPAKPWWRSEPMLYLEIFALCGFVVVQPLLEIIGSSPDFFIFHGVGPLEIVALVAIMVMVPPTVLWGVGALTGLISPAVRWSVHVATLAVLFIFFMIQIGKHLTEIRGIWLLLPAAALTGLIVAGYLLLNATRQLLRFAAVGPLVFVLLFTFASPASAVVFADNRPSEGGEAEVIGPNPPITMIVLDELALVSLFDEAGAIDRESFPNFARLADDSTWYRNATTTAGWTPYALPSMLSGTWPADHAAPHYAVYPDNMFTLLGDVYQISASESISELCPPWHCGDRVDSSRGGLPVALAESSSLLRELVMPVDPPRELHADFAEPTVADRLGAAAAAREDRPEFMFQQALAASQPVRFHDFMTGLHEAAEAESEQNGAPALDGEELAEAQQPRLNFLHLLLPHTPWTYLPDGMQYESVAGLPVDGEWWGRLAHQRYIAQLQYTDLLLGEVLDQLQDSGRYDESLFVLTADHGVSLTPNGAGSRQLGPDAAGIGELAWVPMFIKEPGQTEGVVDDRNWKHVDLLPTLADLAGVAVPWEVDGISWQREQRTTPGKTFYPDLESPGEIDGPARFNELLADPHNFPPVPPPPLPELLGTTVSEHPVVDSDVVITAENQDAFSDVAPADGLVPALVHGGVPDSVAAGTPLAIAVNGEIAAVVPVVAGTEGHRFAGLIENHGLFVSGGNQLELFLVPDGETLHRA